MRIVCDGVKAMNAAPPDRTWRWQRGAISAAVGLALAIASPIAVMAAASPTAAPSPTEQGLALSQPEAPTPAPKGTTVRTRIRVVNPGGRPVTISIAQRRAILGDNGQVSMGAGADPQWRGRVSFHPATLTLGARQYANVDIDVRVPSTIGSDLHFVGFLLSPVAAAAPGQVSVVNQIGSFVTLDVPGPREARLRVTLQIPSVKIARQARGTLRVANVGHSAVRFWGESDTTSSPGGGAPHQQRFDTSLAPVSTTRSLHVTARSAWLVGFVRLRGQIVYPSTTASATTAAVFSKRVLIIDPRVIIAIAGLLLAGASWAGVRLRRRRAQRRPAPQAAVLAGRHRVSP